MTVLKDFFHDFRIVCALFTIRKIDSGNEMPDPNLFSLFGTAFGLVLCLTGWLLRIIFPCFAASVISALLLPLAYEVLTGWRGLYALTSAIEMRFRRKTVAEALTAAESLMKTPFTAALMTIVYTIRAYAFAALIYSDRTYFLLFASAGDYFIRGRIAGGSFDGASPLFQTKRDGRDWQLPMTISAVVTVLFFSPVSFCGFFMCLAVTGLTVSALPRLLSRSARPLICERPTCSAMQSARFFF